MSWNSRGWVINGSNFTSAPAGPAINAPPVADPQSVSVLEDGYIAITLTATDPEGSPLTYAVLSGPTNGVLTGTAPNLTYTPTANYFGPDSFTFQADDGTNPSNIATISITVINVNDAPIANPQSVSVLEDGYIAITLTGSDIDGDPLTYAVVSPGPASGALTGTAPNLTYTPTPNYFGPDSFSFTVNDGYVDSAPATISITVINVNDAPVANPQSVSVLEDGSLAITLTGSDPDGNPLTYAVVSGPTNGVLTGTAPALTYTPTPNYFGPDAFSFTVNDGYVDSAPATISITVINVNDAPIANPQSVSVNEDGSLAITLTGSDPEGNPLTYAIVTSPSRGTLSGTAPNVTYAPSIHFFGSDSFTFRVNDGYVNSANATVSITVNPVNDAPTVHGQSLSTQVDTPVQLTLIGGDIDTGGYYAGTRRAPQLTYTIVSGPTNGSLSGTAPYLTYTPTTSYVGSDSLTFSASDGYLTSAIATVNITVAAAVTAPTLDADFLTSSTIPSDLTFTRSSTATYVDSTGILQYAAVDEPRFTHDPATLRPLGLQLEKAATNSVTTGQGLNNWEISKLFAQYNTADTAAPDGYFTATRLTEDGGFFGNDNGIKQILPASGSLNFANWTNEQRHTMSVFAKAGTQSHIIMRPAWANSSRWISSLFDLVNGTVTPYIGQSAIGSGFVYDYGIEKYPNGWYRCWISWFAASGFNTGFNQARICLSNGTPPGNDGLTAYPVAGNKYVYLWGAQVELQTDRPSTPIITTGSAATRAADTLTVASTAGWYNDADWSVVHSAEYNMNVDPLGPTLPATWRAETLGSASVWRRIEWSKELGQFVAIANGGSRQIGVSNNGIDWQLITPPAANGWRDVAWSPSLGMWVSVADSGTNRIMYSRDGLSWTGIAAPIDGYAWTSVTWADSLSKFVAVHSSNNNVLMQSTDGYTWTTYTAAQALSLNHIDFADNYFLVTGTGNSYTARSADGVTWTQNNSFAGVITYGESAYSPALDRRIVVATGGNSGERWSWTNNNGLNWTHADWSGVMGGAPLQDMTWSDDLGMFVAVASGGKGSPFVPTQARMYTSPTGQNDWTAVPYDPLYGFATNANVGIDTTTTIIGVAWSRELGIFATCGDGAANNAQRVRISAPRVPQRTLLRLRSTAATDTWVTGTSAGFLGSNIANCTLAKFAYYNYRLTDAQFNILRNGGI